MVSRQPPQSASPVHVLRGASATTVKRGKQKKCRHVILIIVITTTIISQMLLLTWHQSQTTTLASFQGGLTAGPQQNVTQHEQQPIRFIAVVGMYHSGTTAMWQSIKSNEHIATKKGIDLHVYAMSDSGGYPPCGVQLQSDSSVDMHATMGHNGTGIDEPNSHLFALYGTMWGDWAKEGPHSTEGLLKMDPPNKRDVFYTWWKHTPPQHPILCMRDDTLYIVMVRHPKSWYKSVKRKLYDFKYDKILKLWNLVRSNPRRLPPMELRFRSLYNAWEYYMKGYTSWEKHNAGKNCYVYSSNSDERSRRNNCLGGTNNIANGKRNILLVRYEGKCTTFGSLLTQHIHASYIIYIHETDYLINPKEVLARIFSFATRGLIDEKIDLNKFVPSQAGITLKQKKQLKVSLHRSLS